MELSRKSQGSIEVGKLADFTISHAPDDHSEDEIYDRSICSDRGWKMAYSKP